MLGKGTLIAAIALVSFIVSDAAQGQTPKAQTPKAQTKPQAGEEQAPGGQTTERDRDKNTPDRDKSPRGVAHRASKIQGMSVKNGQGEALGSVNDIVIDVRAGKVKYAALSYGRVLGLGGKFFAVPWTAFEKRHDPSKNEHMLVLNIDEAMLKNAPGFESNKWPDFGDPRFSDEIEKHYEKLRSSRNLNDDGAKKGADVDIRAGIGGVRVDVDVERNRDRAGKPAQRSGSELVIQRASDIIGMPVRNPDGKQLGSVNDLLIDMDTGNVRYAALSYGGFIGLGDKLFATPWDSFDCKYDSSADEHILVLAVDEAKLRKAPGFDQSNWPDLANPDFGAEVDQYYESDKRRSDPREKSRTIE